MVIKLLSSMLLAGLGVWGANVARAFLLPVMRGDSSGYADWQHALPVGVCGALAMLLAVCAVFIIWQTSRHRVAMVLSFFTALFSFIAAWVLVTASV